MPIVTKKEIERLKESYSGNPQIELIFKDLVETIEKSMEVVGFYSVFNDSGEMADNLYRQYEKEEVK
jgi:hypothetical protein